MKKIIMFFLLFFIIFLSTIIAENPSQKNKYFYKAISYFLLKEKKASKNYLNQYLQYENSQKLKNAYNYLFNSEKLDAMDVFEELVGRGDKNLYTLIGYALSSKSYSSYHEKYYLELARDLFTNSSIVYLVYGNSYLQEGNTQNAYNYIRRAIQRYNLPEYHLVLSQYYKLSGNLWAEIRTLQNYLDKTNFKKGYLRIAEIYIQQNNEERALDFLEENENKLSDNDKYYILKSKLLRKQLKIDKAQQSLNNVSNKKDRFYLLEKGILLFLKNEKQKAKNIFDNIKSESANNNEFCYYYGLTWLTKNAAISGKWLLRAGILGFSEKEITAKLKKTPKYKKFRKILNNKASLGFFKISGFEALENNKIIVWGKYKIEPYNYFYIINNKGSITKSFKINSTIYDISISKDNSKIAIIGFSDIKATANFYLINLKNNSLTKLNNSEIEIKEWNSVFSDDYNKIYFLEKNYISNIYSAPFTIESTMGKLYSFYPEILIRGYIYDIKKRFLAKINESSIDYNTKVFNDLNKIISFYNKFNGFKNLIETGKTISINSPNKMDIYVFENYIVVLESTTSDSFIYNIYSKDGDSFKGKSSDIVKDIPYDIFFEVVNLDPPNNYIFLKGGSNFLIVNFKKNKLVKKITDFKDIVYTDNMFYFIAPDSKVYNMNILDKKVEKALMLLNYQKIYKTNKALYFVNNNLWLYKIGEHRENFLNIYSKTGDCKISNDGKIEVFNINNRLYILDLLE